MWHPCSETEYPGDNACRKLYEMAKDADEDTELKSLRTSSKGIDGDTV